MPESSTEIESDSGIARVANKGERLVISRGDYSDYQILTIAEVVETFDVGFAARQFQAWSAARNIEFGDKQYQFLAWLINVRKVLVEVSVDWREWYLGSTYSTLGKDDRYGIAGWRDGESWGSEYYGESEIEDVRAAADDKDDIDA